MLAFSPLRGDISSAIICGLTLHLLFNRLEETRAAFLKRLLLILPLAPSYLLWSHDSPFLSALVLAYATTYATLLTSIIIYRLSPIHPLAKYPGPFLARCTKFWGVYHSSTGKMHLKSLELHRRYGSIVRCGPNELSFCDLNTVQPVLGSDGLGKGPIWDGRRGPKSRGFALIGIRNTTEHLKRRKLWNRAFSTAGTKAYEPILRNRLDQLVESLKSQQGESLNLAESMSFFAYDFMGDMAFGGGFELMRDGDKGGLWSLMERGIRVQAYTQHVPWALPILYGLPGIGQAGSKLLEFVFSMSKKRIEHGAPLGHQDLSSYLLDEGSAVPKPLLFVEFTADAFLAVVAGSDTAATVMSNVFFYILSDKSLFARLRAELHSMCPLFEGKLSQDAASKLSNAPLLNAIINETMRLQPPVPTGLQRSPDKGTGGKIIGSVFVPEGTGVYISPYSLHRDPRYFSPEPDRFWPERWLDGEGFHTNQAAFIPFSIGPMNCVGKPIAQMELRFVIATLVQQFDMDLEASWGRNQWEDELEDYFVFKKGALPVIIKSTED
ncbi:cytochrome P450 [Mycena floridula]|nr:cytochrome P450 [Mycena floridula]